jgi:predicted acetyltransferase
MTDGEFRRIPPDRLDEYDRAVGYGFSPEDGPGEGEDPEVVADRPGERFGVFVDEELQSVCKHYDFETRLRGTWVPLAGLAAVATPPEHRGQGHVSRIVAASLDRWRGEYPLSALWPFDREFYGQFGWATANTTVKYTCPPEALGVALATDDDGGGGRFRPVTVDDWPALQSVHEAHAADRTLPLRRDETWWREKVLRASDDDRPHAYVRERDGEARGYLVYDVEKTGGGLAERRLEVSDVAFVDHEARLALLRYLADHDSQATEVVHFHEDESLLDLVTDPSAVDCAIHAGPMVRVVDVAHALSSVPYPADATLDLTLAVADRTAPWNDGVFRLRVANGDGECAQTDAPRAEADVTLDVGPLSQLVVGYRSVGTLRRRGDLDGTDGAVADLSVAFPEETVYLRQYF